LTELQQKSGVQLFMKHSVYYHAIV